MEKKKGVPRTFRRRLSAFLSAADSVTEVMQRQGRKYRRQKGESATFNKWFLEKQDLFRTPGENKGRNTGTDAVWVYLRAARHQTIHIQQVRVHEKRQFLLNARLIVHEDKSGCVEVIVGWEADEVPHCCCPFSTPFPQTHHAPFNAMGFPASSFT